MGPITPRVLNKAPRGVISKQIKTLRRGSRKELSTRRYFYAGGIEEAMIGNDDDGGVIHQAQSLKLVKNSTEIGIDLSQRLDRLGTHITVVVLCVIYEE